MLGPEQESCSSVVIALSSLTGCFVLARFSYTAVIHLYRFCSHRLPGTDLCSQNGFTLHSFWLLVHPLPLVQTCFLTYLGDRSLPLSQGINSSHLYIFTCKKRVFLTHKHSVPNKLIFVACKTWLGGLNRCGSLWVGRVLLKEFSMCRRQVGWLASLLTCDVDIRSAGWCWGRMFTLEIGALSVFLTSSLTGGQLMPWSTGTCLFLLTKNKSNFKYF